MKGFVFSVLLLSLVCGGFFADTSHAAAAKETRMALPAPQKKGGMPLMEALNARHANRKISNKKPVDMQTLSNLLWATWGVNRPDGKRTAPTAMNKQEIQVYAAIESGVWLYDGNKNELVQVLQDDVRSKFGGVPVTLLFVAPANGTISGLHAGSLYQNAGLFCASAGLANVVKITGRHALKDMLTFPDKYDVLVIQCIGWPE
ncbi:MAG: hypothetical protein DELT_01584 [Desulfovibrio sp.]